MFAEKDIINTDSFISIADIAMTEDMSAPRTYRRKYHKLLSWLTRKTRSSRKLDCAERLAFVIPGRDEIIFFVKTDFLAHFMSSIRPHLRQKYKIITGSSDYTIPSGGAGDFTVLLDDNLLVSWYGYNIVTNHPKLKPIPLGIPTLRALELGHQFGDNRLFLRKLNEFRQNPGRHKKPKLIYWGSPGNTTPSRREIFNNTIRKIEYVTITERRDYEDYLTDLEQHKFVICPEGNGLDTLRVWESLHFRAIPVVNRSVYMSLYDGEFPILYVDKWPELDHFTPDFLNEEYVKLMEIHYEDKLRFEYWADAIIGNTQDWRRIASS